MYPVCHLIALAVWTIVMAHCLGKKVKEEQQKVPQNKKNSTPIAYEADPEVLERERRQRAAENRERMKKKREKTSKMDILKVEEPKKEKSKLKEKQKILELPEDATQPTNSFDDVRTAQAPIVIESEPDTIQMMVDEEKKMRRSEESKSTTTEEQLGEVRLVDNDPDCALKASLVKKQAREVAKKKQIEEAMMRKMNLLDPLPSPDDTLKNVSSLQCESQMSVIQKRKERQNRNKEMKPSAELCGVACEPAKEEPMMEPKSNELYAREAAKVGGT